MKRYFFGEWKSGESPLTVNEVISLCHTAESRRKELETYPIQRVYELLGKLSAYWADTDRLKTLRDQLPLETGFSSEMVELGLKELPSLLDPEILRKKVKTELRGIGAGEIAYDRESRTELRWHPLGVLLHVLSGNVFLVGVGSWLEGVLTGNVNILKVSSAEKIFLPHFVESLIECDSEGVISKSLALIDYSSSNKGVLEEIKRRVDGIVLWGGEEAVRGYRDGLPARTKIIVYGPKISVAVVSHKGLEEWGVEKVADTLAKEISVWDQNACTAPQVCFVEGVTEAEAVAAQLAVSLEAWEKKLPSGPAEVNTAIEIQKARGVAEVAEARGIGKLWSANGSVNWTVRLDPEQSVEPSPLHRTVRVIPISSINDLEHPLEDIRGYLQTVGAVIARSERREWERRLAGWGACRFLELGQMAGGEIDDPHDGSYDLPQLVHLICKRFPSDRSDLHPLDVISPDGRLSLINARLERLVHEARKSSFYGDRLARFEVRNIEQLASIPILTRDEMEANLPPRSQGLQTREWSGGYVSRSGGSTGEPKFSIYDGEDWEQMIENAVRVFRAAGLERGDRLANCMLAGDLYGSFVSFDHVNCRLGATTFAFAGELNPEVFLQIWRKFKLNAIQAIPTVLVPLLRVAKQLDPEFTYQKVVYAGTPLSPTDREWMMENVKTERISSIIGANDGGQVGFQCAHLKGALHHTIDDFNWIEIVDDAGKPVKAGESGRILITSLLKYAFPLIRYELGDAGRFVAVECGCGRTNRVLEYLGRSDDTICVALMNLRYRDFLTALAGFPISAMQLAAKNNEEGEFIELRIETEAPTVELKQRIFNRVLESNPTVKKRLEEGNLARLEISLVPPGALPRNTRSGKIKSVSDERE